MANLTNTTLGSCKILKPLDKGGMGEIYLAQQLLLHRTVVVKVIRTDNGQSSSSIKRFEREARALAALEHPHIIPLYEYGYENEVAYFIMPYIAGGTLRERVQRGALPPVVVVHLLEQIATALDFAHQHFIVHRDIKPANVLLRDDDWPLLSDFGIAKLMADITQSTRGHVGTPLYMAPEQWTGQEVSGQTDIYALGIMLYELLAGIPPFKGMDWGSVMRQHLQDLPGSLCAHNPTIPLALEEVIFQAMAKKPSQRFSTAKELALAARKALDGKKALLTQQTHSTLQPSLFQEPPTTQQRATSTVSPALDPPHTHLPQTSQENTDAQATTSLIATTSEAETQPGISIYPTLKESQPNSSLQLPHIPIMTTEWKNLPGAMDTIAFLPEANKIVSSTLNTIFLWQAGDPYPIAQLSGHTRTIWTLAVTADGQQLASGSWDRSIRLWDIAQRRPKRVLMGHNDIILALTLAMNDRMLISASRDGTLRYWELPSGRQLRSIRHPGGPIWSLAALPSDDMVVAGTENGSVGLWSLKNGHMIWNTSLGDVGQVHRLLILHSQQVLCITQKGILSLVNLSTGAIQKILTQPATPLDNAVVLDTKIIYTDTSGTLYRWNVESGQQHLAVRTHQSRILAMAVQPTSGVVATGGNDRSIKLWQL